MTDLTQFSELHAELRNKVLIVASTDPAPASVLILIAGLIELSLSYDWLIR